MLLCDHAAECGPVIRVFSRRTKMTPDDPLAFVGDPPLFRPPEMPVRVSCTFTWDRPEAERLGRAWGDFYQDVQVGGPAFGDPGGEFEPGLFVRAGAVQTSRGCIRNCEFCMVPSREGRIRELPIRDGYNILDNNLLACSDAHINSVFEMLSRQRKAARFTGGLDARLFQKKHADLLGQIRVGEMFFAADEQDSERHLHRIADLLGGFPVHKRRCYVLIGFDGESIGYSEDRLERVYELGFWPFAMLYRDLYGRKWSSDWKALQRKWCRPAAYRRKEKEDNDATL